MTGADYRSHTDAELVDVADSGLRGQGAVVEALWRHREALLAEQKATERLTRVAVVLAAASVILAGLQIWVTVLEPLVQWATRS